MSSKNQTRTHILVECAILLSVATVLSFFPKIDGIWAHGGSITICSMLPIILVSYKHGIKWGLLTGLAFSFLQILTGGFYPAGTTLAAAFFTFLLDYLFPYTVIGLGGMFRKRIKSTSLGLVLGTVIVLLMRYAFHVTSGFVLWKSIEAATSFLATPGFSIGAWAIAGFSGDALCLVYSFIYNGSYMLPEIVITALGAYIASRVKPLQLKSFA
ncbi:MAG: energy-coupled thiamine transporter ThiT [Oscillospiraceae bacterium]|nr:energy-coupled thiamine transporter ThiT [Oscillospiraceae bacterium]